MQGWRLKNPSHLDFHFLGCWRFYPAISDYDHDKNRITGEDDHVGYGSVGQD